MISTQRFSSTYNFMFSYNLSLIIVSITVNYVTDFDCEVEANDTLFVVGNVDNDNYFTTLG